MLTVTAVSPLPDDTARLTLEDGSAVHIQPVTTAALGRQHPYALRTMLTPLEAEVVRGLVLGNMTTWPSRYKTHCCGAHFDTASDLWTAQLLIAAMRAFASKKALWMVTDTIPVSC